MSEIGWLAASAVSVAIVGYFALTLVWLPSFVLRAAGDAPRIVRDLLGSGIWLVFLVLGLWGLGRLQRGR